MKGQFLDVLRRRLARAEKAKIRLAREYLEAQEKYQDVSQEVEALKITIKSEMCP